MTNVNSGHRRPARLLAGWVAAATGLAALLLSASVSPARAGNPFSSNVVALTSKNWAEEVLDSPHPVFINICRMGCGYCQQLSPEWERLAKAVKGTVKIAYFDTEQAGGRPRLLGDFQGTPTIRLFVPKVKQGNSNRKKIVNDYQYERKATEMKRWLDSSMNSFVERIKGTEGLQKFVDKATRNGLPRAILFTSKASTMPLTKYLSVEFRRRLLVGEVHPTKTNADIIAKFGVKDTPALVLIPADAEGEGSEAEPIWYEGGDFTRRKLHSFLSQHALKDPVFPSKKTEGGGAEGGGKPKTTTTEEPEKKKVKEEL